ncbi:MAG: BlaI/MecI/CopY family transcriptional regulator [Pirellulales bacterium]
MPEPTPTDRELEALKVLWDRGEATVREVCDALNAADESLAYTTVLSLLQVMEQKGLVTHRQDGKAYVYMPAVERGTTFRQLASGFLEKVFDGAVDEYLVHALGSRKLSGEELAKIEALLEAARGQGKKDTGDGGQGTESESNSHRKGARS